MEYQAELAAAREAATQATKIILECYDRFRTVADAPASIHTEADARSQETILAYLRKKFPGDAFCAEEITKDGKVIAGTGPRLWIIDPVDGSRGFARKNDEFSVMIGFVDQGKAVVGVVQEPARQRLTWAVKGQGCWRQDGSEKSPNRCQVSQRASLAEAVLVQSRSRDPGVPSGQVQALQPVRVVEAYSAGLKMALVARGECDLYVNRYQAFHDWDICAGHVLIAEAGGKSTGLKGEDLFYGSEGAWQRTGLLSSNTRLHEAALAKLAAVV